MHLPGHTAGHCALLVEPQGVAFIGDIDLSGFGPYYGDATSSLAAFRRTLQAVYKTCRRRCGHVAPQGRDHRPQRPSRPAAGLYARRIDERAERLLQMLSPGRAAWTTWCASG
jgi:glyoxylase-like metal-dependent hydrolase (beta-lactamase superfamily II)